MDDFLAEEACREQAQELLPKLKLLDEWFQERADEEPRRAFIVEFAGMPKSGKTSAIENVRHYFSHGPKLLVDVKGPQLARLKRGYLLHTPAEGVSLRTPRFLQTNRLDFNAWAGAYAVQELLVARHDNYHHLVILDRGPWDASCWIEHVFADRPQDLRLPVEEAEPIRSFFKLPYWATLSDLHVVLVVDPKEAKSREVRSRLIDAGGAASDEQLMARMREIYSSRAEELRSTKASHCPDTGAASVLVIDTTDLDKKKVALEIIASILNVIETKLISLRETTPLFTTRELGELLLPLMEGRSEAVRAPVRRFLPLFVSRANDLKAASRAAVRTALTELLEPSLNKVNANEVVPKLEDLLSRHETTKE